MCSGGALRICGGARLQPCLGNRATVARTEGARHRVRPSQHGLSSPEPGARLLVLRMASICPHAVHGWASAHLPIWAGLVERMAQYPQMASDRWEFRALLQAAAPGQQRGGNPEGLPHRYQTARAALARNEMYKLQGAAERRV
jgi:hypothetical protein